MAKVTVQLEGFESLQRALVRAPEVLRARAASAIAESTLSVARRARAIVPVDTGDLKRAITTAGSVDGLTGSVGLASKDTFYWRFVEFGTIHRAARPFFRPAAEEERNAFIERMRQIGPEIHADLDRGSR